jgi:hypothetical protein
MSLWYLLARMIAHGYNDIKFAHYALDSYIRWIRNTPLDHLQDFCMI